MTDRSRRVRRQISEATEDFTEESDLGSGEDYDPRRSDSMRRAGRYESSAASTPASSRPRRSGASATASNVSSATVQRGSSSADDRRQSLKLTVKAPPSKLREVMRANEVDSLHDTLGGGKVLNAPRSSRRTAVAARASARGSRRPTYAEYGESDIEDEEEDEDEEEEDEEEEEEEEEPNDFDQLGAEPEGGTDDEDVEMEDAPPPPPPPPPRRHAPPKPPKITLKPPAKGDSKSSAKPKLIVTPAKIGPLKSVEEQEMEDESEDESVEDDDEVGNSSELSDEDEEPTINVHDEDAEGEEEEIVVEEDAPAEDEELDEEDEDEDELDDSSDETPASGAATPDPTRMTKRQRGRPEDQGSLMALDMAPQQRKFFTDEEKAMKKDEHARKRKELTKRKVQEEKTAALNRLLKPQVSKARGAAPKPETLAAAAAAAAAAGSPFEEEDLPQRANPIYTRWLSTQDGVRLGVPEEWLGKKVGRYFGPPLPPNGNVLIQEIE